MTECTERIIGVLEPSIGRGMAKSALRIKCKKLGIVPENITAEKVPILADDLYEPLMIFAGEEFAKTLTMQIKNITCSGVPAH
jgi:hypothetical protein